MKKYNPRQEQTLNRRISQRRVKQSFLIVTEGERTEPAYFNSFRVTSAKIKTIGKGMSTISLVNEAVLLKEIEKRRGNTYDQYWVVFDKDDYAPNDFNEAIRIAESAGFNVAYSNQSIEYWFLLHFNLYQGSLHRDKCNQLLSKLFGEKYSKTGKFPESIYGRLLPMQEDAIKRSKYVIEQFRDVSPAFAESSTLIHLLVNELNKYI